jgi:hypothetical protein
MTKREAQQRADRLRVFRQEWEALERQGVLSWPAEQRAAVESYVDQALGDLAARYDIDTTDTQKQFSWGMRIASTLGGLALCAAVYLFFYRIWGWLGTPAQVGILILAPLASLAATHFAATRDRTLYYATLLSLVAFGCFVLNLNALGAIFQVTPSPNAFLAWGALGVSLAYAYGLRLPLAAGLVCLWLWAAAVIASASGHWLAVPQRPENFLAPGLALIGCSFLSFPRQDDFPVVYRLLGLLSVFVTVAVLSEVDQASYLPMAPKRVEIFYQLIGFGATGGAMWQSIRRGWQAELYLSAAFFLFFFYARLVHWWWDWMPRYLFFFLIGLISLGLLALFRRLRRTA